MKDLGSQSQAGGTRDLQSPKGESFESSRHFLQGIVGALKMLADSSKHGDRRKHCGSHQDGKG